VADVGIDKLLQQVAELRRQMGQMIVHGPVSEVKGDKVRVKTGKDAQGQDVLSPWLDTNNHRGGATERRFFKVGQNVSIFSPGGDMTQGIITPYAPNKDHKAPDHANESGTDEETYQFEDLRVKKVKDGYDVWMNDDKETSSAKTLFRLKKDGGFMARTIKDDEKYRVVVTDKGTKLHAQKGDQKQYFVVQYDKIITSSIAAIADDPLTPNDDT
jgi:hypothetical protein